MKSQAMALLCQSMLMFGLVAGLGWSAPLAADDQEQKVALDYYRELAENGSADAQLTLGDIYSNGNGVQLDLVEAYVWYYLAAQQGVEEAIQPMNNVLKALPESQWQEAKRRAEAYERRFVPKRS